MVRHPLTPPPLPPPPPPLTPPPPPPLPSAGLPATHAQLDRQELLATCTRIHCNNPSCWQPARRESCLNLYLAGRRTRREWWPCQSRNPVSRSLPQLGSVKAGGGAHATAKGDARGGDAVDLIRTYCNDPSCGSTALTEPALGGLRDECRGSSESLMLPGVVPGGMGDSSSD